MTSRRVGLRFLFPFLIGEGRTVHEFASRAARRTRSLSTDDSAIADSRGQPRFTIPVGSVGNAVFRTQWGEGWFGPPSRFARRAAGAQPRPVPAASRPRTYSTARVPLTGPTAGQGERPSDPISCTVIWWHVEVHEMSVKRRVFVAVVSHAIRSGFKKLLRVLHIRR